MGNDDSKEKFDVLKTFLCFISKKAAYCRDDERLFVRTTLESCARNVLKADHFSFLAIRTLVDLATVNLQRWI